MFDKRAKIENLPLDEARRVLVIADVHGNLPYLRGVLSLADFGEGDFVVFDGDFLEKGEQSLETLRFVMALCAEGRAAAVCGNCDGWADIFSMSPEDEAHTLHYLAWRRCGLVWDMCRELGLNPLAGDFPRCKASCARPLRTSGPFSRRCRTRSRASAFSSPTRACTRTSLLRSTRPAS